jgi:hypothetical protein
MRHARHGFTEKSNGGLGKMVAQALACDWSFYISCSWVGRDLAQADGLPHAGSRHLFAAKPRCATIVLTARNAEIQLQAVSP